MAVSSTSIRGFSQHKSLVGNMLTGANLEVIIDASSTITIGDAVRINQNGYVVRAATSGNIAGICVGLIDQYGINVFSPRAQGTTGATLTPQDTIAVSATNVTDATRNLKAQILADPAGYIFWRNQASATGLAAANLFQFYNLTTAGQIDQTTNSNTSGQFQLVGLDPDNDGVTSKGLFRIVQSELATNVPSYGTTVIRAA